MLNTPAFKQYLSEVPTTILSRINETMIKFLKSESGVLYNELMSYVQVFTTETTELISSL